MIEPVDTFQRGVFNGFEPPLGTSSMDDLGLVEAVVRDARQPTMRRANVSMTNAT